ncbi:MAG: DUF6494 family protein [Pseudomonadota bacterium]
MSEPDAFNMSLRKFLKTVGVTSQREIEEAVRTAQEVGTLPAGPLTATVTLTIDGIGLRHHVSGEIEMPSDGH